MPLGRSLSLKDLMGLCAQGQTDNRAIGNFRSRPARTQFAAPGLGTITLAVNGRCGLAVRPPVICASNSATLRAFQFSKAPRPIHVAQRFEAELPWKVAGHVQGVTCTNV